MRATRGLAGTSLRESRRAVSPIISTILLVAITVILSTALYFFVTGAFAPPPQPTPAVALSSEGWSGPTYTASVSGVSNVASIEPSNLDFKVEDAQGNLYFVGRNGGTNTTGGITVTVLFNDLDHDGRISGADTVTITVDPPAAGSQAISGGVVRVVYKSAVIATHSIA